MNARHALTTLHSSLTAVCAPVALLLSACSVAPANEEAVSVSGRTGYSAYTSEQQRISQDEWGYAAAYRAGDYVYLSGVVVGVPPGETLDRVGFRERVCRTLQYADRNLEAAGSDIRDVAEIISFHVWDSPHLALTKLEHLEVIAEVKRQFIEVPHPAWSAIGVSELLPDTGLVELRMVAYSPTSGAQRRSVDNTLQGSMVDCGDG